MPRNGQWVKLTKDMVFGGQTEKAGTVGIYVGPATQKAPDGTVAPIVGQGEIHLVDVPQGTTRLKVAVPNEAVVGITDRKDIPADRLATMDPAWVPVA